MNTNAPKSDHISNNSNNHSEKILKPIASSGGISETHHINK